MAIINFIISLIVSIGAIALMPILWVHDRWLDRQISKELKARNVKLEQMGKDLERDIERLNKKYGIK